MAQVILPYCKMKFWTESMLAFYLLSKLERSLCWILYFALGKRGIFRSIGFETFIFTIFFPPRRSSSNYASSSESVIPFLFFWNCHPFLFYWVCHPLFSLLSLSSPFFSSETVIPFFSTESVILFFLFWIGHPISFLLKLSSLSFLLSLSSSFFSSE